MAKKPDPPPDDPEQSARFVEMAKALDTKNGKAAFGRVIKKVVPKKNAPSNSPVTDSENN